MDVVFVLWRFVCVYEETAVRVRVGGLFVSMRQDIWMVGRVLLQTFVFCKNSWRRLRRAETDCKRHYSFFGILLSRKIPRKFRCPGRIMDKYSARFPIGIWLVFLDIIDLRFEKCSRGKTLSIFIAVLAVKVTLTRFYFLCLQ